MNYTNAKQYILHVEKSLVLGEQQKQKYLYFQKCIEYFKGSEYSEMKKHCQYSCITQT